jgi:hypothetical protein
MISNATERVIFRWVHIVFGFPVIGYIYSPFDAIPNYAHTVRFVFMPILLVSGLWMWKGQALRRALSPRRQQVHG